MFMYFLGMAFLSLLIELWKDLTTLRVDSRRAWFMQGAGLALAIAFNGAINYIIAVALIMFFCNWLEKREKTTKRIVFADGDREILRWLVPGLFALYPLYAVVFLLNLIPALFGLSLLRKYTKTKVSPGVLAIFTAFVCTGTLVMKGLLTL